ncbi:hypothetical protein [Noviherbaspirillum saxi]|uniref:Putative 4-hydroxy-4-methyl-2-oxoglutarate aldolase n=1 Tax=Noviherbaspirillum saxi TaxID=2320863 RepID=A0A3A3FG67_9BURK|nr:hypothetical protein [Noviherbaspirillum saxi]RJF92087.1 hypothetical protein D3871_25915 [Noviherbaspirillum saxi]
MINDDARSPKGPVSLNNDQAFSTADLHDRYMDTPGLRLQVARSGLIALAGQKHYCGQIATVSGIDGVPPRLTDILAEPGNERVLVVDGGGPEAAWAILGDRMAMLGLRNNWAGIIIHGYVRDLTILRDIPLGIHALGSLPSKPCWPASVPCEREISLAFQHISFCPNHWLYADEDGIVVADRKLSL